MPTPVFVGGLRTPFGRSFKGAYKDVRADDLLVELLSTQAKKYPELKSRTCDLLVGCAYPEGEQGYNTARMCGLGAGFEVAGATVNRLCASSLEVVAMAASRVVSGWGDVYLTAGIESMSRITRRGSGFSESDFIKSRVPEAYVTMGQTAENVAERYPHITREMQEDLSALSHENAFRAYERGDYADQIHRYLIDQDEFIRFPVNREKVSSLKPAFADDGVVTAATSSPITDGATSGWVLSEKVARELGFNSWLEIVDVTVAHVAPELMGLGPIPAMSQLFKRNEIGPEMVSAYEINEAFAIQVLACAEELDLPSDRINGWGGAMALGHPLGASGLRLLMTLHDRLEKNSESGSLGIASLCVGGGQGMAVLTRLARA